MPVPTNLIIKSYNLNPVLHWRFQNTSATPVFTVQVKTYEWVLRFHPCVLLSPCTVLHSGLPFNQSSFPCDGTSWTARGIPDCPWRNEFLQNTSCLSLCLPMCVRIKDVTAAADGYDVVFLRVCLCVCSFLTAVRSLWNVFECIIK